MKTRQLFVYSLLLLCVTALVTGCGAAAAPLATPPPAATSVAQDADEQYLADQDFGTVDKILQGTVPPNMSSYRYNPEQALGAMFEKVLKANPTDNSCASTNPDDFELVRIVNVAPLPGCEATVSEPNQKAEERIVRGGVNARVNHLVGEVGLKAEYAFELLVTTPLAANYSASQQCVDTQQVSLMPTSPRSCEIYFVTGATLTQITYRQYSEVTGDAKYNALITVDGQLYGSTTFMRSYPILTVDFVSLSNWFDRNEAGFVVTPTVAQAEEAVETIQSLSPEEFIREAALPAPDLRILPQLSIENLLEDPTLRIDPRVIE